jgi:putative ABC transport system ATP-binding protein
MNSSNAFRLENVSKYYSRGSETVTAVRDVSFEVSSGGYVAIVGHSGSGKTTLLNLIGCLDRPSEGRIMVGGEWVHDAGEKDLIRLRRSSVGFVFQQFFLIPTLNVLENVTLPALFSKQKSNGRARELLELVELDHRLDHLPGQLSGGEMQRVAVARALINSPSILLADEPTGNLDSRNAEKIMGLFEELNRGGVTVVVVTHNQDIVKRFDRTVHIEDGSIIS